MKHKFTICSLCLGILALAVPGGAQTKSSATLVTLSDGRGCNSSSQPHFEASSITTNISFPDNLFTSGPRTFSDIVLTKNFDDCSISLYKLLFTSTHVETVVISFTDNSGPGQKATEVMRVTLTKSLITSMADADSSTTAPAERVTLSYQKIAIFDPVTNTTVSYDRSAETSQ